MTFSHFDALQLRSLENDALAVVRELGSIGLSLFRGHLSATQKADGSLVSEADRSIERLARRRLAQLTPEFGFVGEEYGTVAKLSAQDFPRRVGQDSAESRHEGLHPYESALHEQPQELLNLDSDTYWILDPIDGTINFLSRVPLWSTLLALVHKGKPVLGIVALPALNEIFSASSGNGSRWSAINFESSAPLQDLPWVPCRPRQNCSLKDALISYSTPKTFAYRGIETFLPILQKQSKECRTHSDAFGYTRVLVGGVDVMMDPLVAPYDVAALQVLFDETPGAVFTTLQGHVGPTRFRMGSALAAVSQELTEEVLNEYREHLVSTAIDYCQHENFFAEPLIPEQFQPTFLLDFEQTKSRHVSKLWARALETAVADFLIQNPSAFVEDVSILLGTRESALRVFSNGRNEGPPEYAASTTFHVRAVVSGCAGLSTGTPGFEFDPVEQVKAALWAAWKPKSQPRSLDLKLEENTLSARDPLIAHVGQHPWRSLPFAEDFASACESIQLNQGSKLDERIVSVKTRFNLNVEYRWQYFMDASQQTFVTQVCQLSSRATSAEKNEKRTSYKRYLQNKMPSPQVFLDEVKKHLNTIQYNALQLLPAALVPENPEYDFLAVDADLLGLILHEAVGHAAEGDLIQTRASGFGHQGEMKDLVVGPEWLDIVIDGTLDNCGYLPIDAEGVVPRRKTLVRQGRLVDAIHTRATAKTARKSPDGSSRLQSLQHPSLNRMTSIWVCPARTHPLELSDVRNFAWDELPADVIQKTLEKNGYLDGSKGVLLLSGWKGGTASCSNLEFRADVVRILHLKKGQSPVLMREANFTGIATECFRSAVDAFGPMLCRSIGTCGKDGQGVLTSDGGPAFMLFKPNPQVRVVGSGEAEGGDAS